MQVSNAANNGSRLLSFPGWDDTGTDDEVPVRPKTLKRDVAFEQSDRELVPGNAVSAEVDLPG